jgi:hypothetical protein
MTIDIVTIDNSRVRTIEMINVRGIAPCDDSTLTIVNWFHIPFLITPNVFRPRKLHALREPAIAAGVAPARVLDLLAAAFRAGGDHLL